ncbi:MAG: isoprenylcysteine carboxylmethyltransferase family protein [Porphyromonadaceae bacterium]|nr:MAG: isoprenylcysteine carboxylmethyltransferase family protein [Porphyromonadaceae bacterium]
MNQSTSNIIAFLIGSIPIIYLSWRSLGSTKNHGFFRFFAWEIILWLLVINIRFWFKDPFSWHQIISWILLLISIYPVIDGVYRFKAAGRINHERKDTTLFDFEHTTSLITTGVYRYIRHPMYASLLYLTWGIAFKNPSVIILIYAEAATIFLYLTVRVEERENLTYFGEEYRQYMKRTKRFVPWLW